MNKSQKQMEEERQFSQYQKLRQSINKCLIERFPNSILEVSNGNVQIRSLEQIEQLMREHSPNDRAAESKGRGGNNMAQNVKKSIQSVLKKILSPNLYSQFMDKYVKMYSLKSQKQNFVLYILFLHDLYFQHKINLQALEIIKTSIINRISKYVHNSQMRVQQDPVRSQFHSKNLIQFQKFLDLDLDFCKTRSYGQLREWIQNQYLKKRAVCRQSEQKVRRIIELHPNLRRIFSDFDVQNMSKSSSQNSENLTSQQNEIKQENNSEY